MGIGGASIPGDTGVEQVADFVAPEDKLPFLLAVSLYEKPIKDYKGYVLIQEWSTPRIGVWYSTADDEWIVGLRGTDVFGKQGLTDLMDDKKIAFGSYCDLSLVKQAQDIILLILDEGYESADITIVGHSLGGAAALCLGGQFGCRCISFNGGASPTNPVLAGPGPALATHYHIFGDLISTHMSTQAARVVRVKGDHTEFGSFYPHATVRFLRSDGVKHVVSATEEDEAFLAWANKFKFTWKLISPVFTFSTYLAYLKTKSIAKKSPIPDSKRALQ